MLKSKIYRKYQIFMLHFSRNYNFWIFFVVPVNKGSISPILFPSSAVFPPHVPARTPGTMGFSASIPLRLYSHVLQQLRQSYEAVPELHFRTSGLSQQLRRNAFYRRLSVSCIRLADDHSL